MIWFFERMSDIVTAIKREKQLKRWHRDWKINLIKEQNPNMEDLAGDGWGQVVRDPETSSG